MYINNKILEIVISCLVLVKSIVIVIIIDFLM